MEIAESKLTPLLKKKQIYESNNVTTELQKSPFPLMKKLQVSSI